MECRCTKLFLHGLWPHRSGPIFVSSWTRAKITVVQRKAVHRRCFIHACARLNLALPRPLQRCVYRRPQRSVHRPPACAQAFLSRSPRHRSRQNGADCLSHRRCGRRRGRRHCRHRKPCDSRQYLLETACPERARAPDDVRGAGSVPAVFHPLARRCAQLPAPRPTACCPPPPPPSSWPEICA